MSTQLITASVRPYENQFDLENAVFEAVCNADPEILETLLDKSDAWMETGHYNDSWAQNNTPNYADASTLGDWTGYSLESVQLLCQDVLEAVIARDGNPSQGDWE
jgi:hypothetical protein